MKTINFLHKSNSNKSELSKKELQAVIGGQDDGDNDIPAPIVGGPDAPLPPESPSDAPIVGGPDAPLPPESPSDAPIVGGPGDPLPPESPPEVPIVGGPGAPLPPE